MKRYKTISVLIAALLLLTMAGCDAQKAPSSDTTPTGTPTAGMPNFVRFYSFGEIAELKTMLKESDEVLEEYLLDTEKISWMNGWFYHRITAEQWFETVGDRAVVYWDDDKAALYRIYSDDIPEHYNFDITYTIGEDQHILFKCYPYDPAGAIAIPEGSIITSFPIGDSTVQIYQLDDGDLHGIVITSNTLIRIHFLDDAKITVLSEAAQNGTIRLMTLNEIIGLQEGD